MDRRSFALLAALAGASAFVAPNAGAAALPVTVYVNGQPMSFDQPPEVRGGRVFVPLRSVFERLGATVVYDNGAINATGGGRTIALRVGSTQATVDGQPQLLDVAPYVEGSRTLVPLRFIATALGASVNWNSATNAVNINGGANAARATVFFVSTVPAANASAAAQPQIAFTLNRPTRPGLFTVWVDGQAVTQFVQEQNPRSYVVVLPYALQPMQHHVRVAGRTDGGVVFDLDWSFTTSY